MYSNLLRHLNIHKKFEIIQIKRPHLDSSVSSHSLIVTPYTRQKQYYLTYTASGQQTSGFFRRITIGVHGFQNIKTERKSDDSLRTWSYNHALHPKPHESYKWPERFHDVRIIGPRLRYHASEFCVTIRTDLPTPEMIKKMLDNHKQIYFFYVNIVKI